MEQADAVWFHGSYQDNRHDHNDQGQGNMVAPEGCITPEVGPYTKTAKDHQSYQVAKLHLFHTTGTDIKENRV